MWGPFILFFHIFLLAANFPKFHILEFWISIFFKNNNNNNLKVRQTGRTFLPGKGQNELSNTAPGGLGHISSWSHSRWSWLFHWPMERFYDTWLNAPLRRQCSNYPPPLIGHLHTQISLQRVSSKKMTQRPTTNIPHFCLKSSFYLSQKLYMLPLLLKTETDRNIAKFNFILDRVVNISPRRSKGYGLFFFPDQKHTVFFPTNLIIIAQFTLGLRAFEKSQPPTMSKWKDK